MKRCMTRKHAMTNWSTRFNEDWVIAPRGSTTIDRVRQVARWSWTVPCTQKAESTASSALVYCSPIRQLLNPAVTTNTQLLSCSVSSRSKIYATSQSNLAHEQISQSFYPHATPPWFNGQYYRTTMDNQYQNAKASWVLLQQMM